MAQNELARQSITRLAEQIAESMGMEVVLVEVRGAGGRPTVRVYLDQPGGVTLDDCERFSKRLSVSLDVEDCIPTSYTLEVSSPGLDRPLVRPEDFERFSGKKARIRVRTARGGQRNFTGRIGGIADGVVHFDIDQGTSLEIDWKEIEKANLMIEL